jgi:hypothetical protein
MEEMQMHPFNLSRRLFLKGTGALSAAAILAAYPGARLIRAQGNAEYDLIDFGPFEVVVSGGAAPGPAGMLWGLNDTGTVCGQIGVSETRFSPATWSSKGKLKRLKSGKLGGAARDINDGGVVVGHEYEPDGERSNTRPVVWRDGEPVELPNLDGDTAGARGVATCISNDGVIGGSVETGDGSQAVLWIDDVAQPLSDGPDGPAGNVNRVNEAGTVLASWAAPVTPQGLGRAYGLWRGDDATVLNVPEEAAELLTLAVSLNGNDEVLFNVYPPGSFDQVFFFITDGESTSVIDNREDGFGSIAADFNDAGVVVGNTYTDEASRAARWENGEFIDLNDLIAAETGLTLTSARAINNAGMITGLATDGEGVQHGYLLIPS